MTLMIGPVYMGPDCADAHSAEQPADIMWSVHIIGSECGEAYSAKQPGDIMRSAACAFVFLAAGEMQFLPRFCVWGAVLHGIGESTCRLSK
jgi:hypothetical protein